jgi:hypothetical protein
MMGHRRFIVVLISLLILFVGINALLWFTCVRDIVSPSRKGGDLVRMGYISGYVVPRQNITDLPARHVDIRQYDKKPVDMVTVGDSFSIGGGYGRNSHYQDYIASLHDLRVLNVPSYRHKGKELQFQPVITLSKLISSGYLDIMKPRYLLLESIERLAIPRLTAEFTLDESSTIAEIDRYFRESSFDQSKNADLELGFVNNGNWKFLANTLQYRSRDRAVDSRVLMTKLSQRFFNSPSGDRLIFYQDDVYATAQSTPESVAHLNRNLNQVAAILRKKGITLIFMPIVDKLNLYHPYLVSKGYPKSRFFEELRKLPKDYLFIDTKAILSPLLEKGELDVFFQDDTHWNWKASKTVFEHVCFGQGER